MISKETSFYFERLESFRMKSGLEHKIFGVVNREKKKIKINKIDSPYNQTTQFSYFCCPNVITILTQLGFDHFEREMVKRAWRENSKISTIYIQTTDFSYHRCLNMTTF